MKSLNIVALASTALVAMRVQAQQQEVISPDSPSYNGTAVQVNCLDAFNEARAAAGLSAFVSAGAEFKVADKPEDFNKKVCQALMTHVPLEAKSDFNKTIALAIQDGTQGDCAAAVTHFNGALSLFGSLPPVYSENESVYKKLQAVSFVALYNPKENPKLDCGYFTCTKTTKVAKAAEVPQTANNDSTTETLKGLLCATTPQALIKDQAPFEQKQYDKIKGAINSASAPMPVLATLAVAAAGLALI